MLRRCLLILLLTLVTSLQANQIERFMGLLEPDRKFSSHGELLTYYHNLIDTEMTAVEEEICKPEKASRADLHHVGNEIFMGLQKDFEKDKATVLQRRECKQPGKRIMGLAQEVFQEFGVSRDLEVYTSPHTSMASVVEDGYICINESEMNQLSDHEIKTILAHEVQHIIFNDAGVSRAIVKALESKLWLQYAQMAEIRADVFAIIQSTCYARASRCMWEKLAKIFGKRCDCDATHPTWQQRATIARTILNQLNGLPLRQRFPWMLQMAVASAKTAPSKLKDYFGKLFEKVKSYGRKKKDCDCDVCSTRAKTGEFKSPSENTPRKTDQN